MMPTDTQTHSLLEAPSPGELHVVVVDGPSAGASVVLRSKVVIGSDESCDLTLEDSTVSRRHAVMSLTDQRVRIRDVGSRNGVFIGDTRVHDGVLSEGAVIRLGKSALALRPRWARREVSASRAHRFGELYGSSVAMREVFAVLERAARSDVPVLIEGETGCGKDLAARSLHMASARGRRPFVVFDCASVPASLAESELFGHVRGAFTGAHQDRQGAFERAHRGTLFLDELGELPLNLQPKLLRVLESGELTRVGDGQPKAVDVRVIAATNRNLHAEVQRGAFRADLFYRLDVVRVHVPPLRHRPEDIQGLATDLLMGKLPPGDEVQGDNLALLMAQPWPGNVRELRNVLMRAIALSPAGARFDDLSLGVGAAPGPAASFGMSYPGVAIPLPYKEAKKLLLDGFERSYLEALMRRHDGNHTQAARSAGISRKHLHELVKKLETGDDDRQAPP